MAPKRKAAAAAAEKKKPAAKKKKAAAVGSDDDAPAGGAGAAAASNDAAFPVKRESGVSLSCSGGRLVVLDPDLKFTDVLRGLGGRSFLGSEPVFNNAASGEWAVRRLRIDAKRNGERTTAVMFVHSKIATLPRSSYLKFRATRDWSDGDAFGDAKAQKSLDSMFKAAERAKAIPDAIPNWEPALDCRNELFIALKVLIESTPITAVHLPVLNLIGQYILMTNVAGDAGADSADSGDAAADGESMADDEPAGKGRKAKKPAAKSKKTKATTAAVSPAPAGDGGYFQVRAKPSASALPVSKWVSAGRVNTDSVALGAFDITDELYDWVNRSAEVSAFNAEPKSAAAELKLKAEFMARLYSLNTVMPKGCFHNYTQWLPADAAAQAAADAKTGTAAAAAPAAGSAVAASAELKASNIVNDKLKDLTHGVWSDSGPGDGEYEVFVKYADVPVAAGLYAPVVVAIYIIFDAGIAKVARKASPPEEDENAPAIPAVPVRPTRPGTEAPKPAAAGAAGAAGGDSKLSAFMAKRAEAKSDKLSAAFARVEADPLTDATSGVIKVEFTTIMGAKIGAKALLCRESDSVDDLRARIHGQYLKDTGLRRETVGIITRRGGGGGVLNMSGPTGLKDGDTCTLLWSFDRSPGASLTSQQALISAAVMHLR